MTAQEMWAAYVALHPQAAAMEYEAWAYGDSPDELAALTLLRRKTATASAHALYALDNSPLPEIGDHSVILNTKDEAVCIIRNVRVKIVPYCEVDDRHAFLEGEGDRSLAYWRQVHEAFFRREYEAAGLPFTEEIAVVCEEFEVVYP